MEKQTNSVETLLEKTADYLETRMELLKLRAVDKVSDVASSMASRLMMAMVIGLLLLILNMGIAFWIGDMLGKMYYGFFLLGAFYLLIVVLFYFFRSKWIKKPLQDSLIKKMLN